MRTLTRPDVLASTAVSVFLLRGSLTGFLCLCGSASPSGGGGSSRAPSR